MTEARVADHEHIGGDEMDQGLEGPLTVHTPVDPKLESYNIHTHTCIKRDTVR